MNIKSKIAVVVIALAMAMAAAPSFSAESTAQPPASSTSPTSAGKKAPPKIVKSTHHKGTPSPHVKAIQEALNSHGASLKADGILGKQTRAAIEKFQKENGLKPTGKADAATLEKLGAPAAPARGKAPKK